MQKPKIYMSWGHDDEYSYYEDLKKNAIKFVDNLTAWIRFFLTSEINKYLENERNFYRVLFVMYCCCIYPFVFFFAFIGIYLSFLSDTALNLIYSKEYVRYMSGVELFYDRWLGEKYMAAVCKFFFTLAIFIFLFRIRFTGKSSPFDLTNTRRSYGENRLEWVYLQRDHGIEFLVLFSPLNVRKYLYKFLNNFVFKAVLSTRISKKIYIKYLYVKNTLKVLVWRPLFKKQGYLRNFFKRFKK